VNFSKNGFGIFQELARTVKPAHNRASRRITTSAQTAQTLRQRSGIRLSLTSRMRATCSGLAGRFFFAQAVAYACVLQVDGCNAALCSASERDQRTRDRAKLSIQVRARCVSIMVRSSPRIGHSVVQPNGPSRPTSVRRDRRLLTHYRSWKSAVQTLKRR